MDVNRLSACTYAVRERDLAYTLDLIAGAGFRKVDLWGGLPNYSTDPSQCDHAALRKAAADRGLTIANLGTYPGRKFASADAAERAAELEDLKRTVDVAVFLGSRSIRVMPGTGEDPGIIGQLVPLFREGAAYAAAKGVYLGMENHKGSIAGNPDACMSLVRQVDSPFFGVLYEPANLMHCGVDYREAYSAFRGHVVHVHVKDSRWVDGRYERTMLGEGDVDLRWLVDSLTADGYAGDFALEYEIADKIPIETGLPQWQKVFAAL